MGTGCECEEIIKSQPVSRNAEKTELKLTQFAGGKFHQPPRPIKPHDLLTKRGTSSPNTGGGPFFLSCGSRHSSQQACFMSQNRGPQTPGGKLCFQSRPSNGISKLVNQSFVVGVLSSSFENIFTSSSCFSEAASGLAFWDRRTVKNKRFPLPRFMDSFPAGQAPQQGSSVFLFCWLIMDTTSHTTICSSLRSLIPHPIEEIKRTVLSIHVISPSNLSLQSHLSISGISQPKSRGSLCNIRKFPSRPAALQPLQCHPWESCSAGRLDRIFMPYMAMENQNQEIYH